MTRLIKRGGRRNAGFGSRPLTYGAKGTNLQRRNSNQTPADKTRPDWLGATVPARGTERRGSAFLAWLSDDLAKRTYLPGEYTSAEAALSAARMEAGHVG
jgi:hypothetical protein